LGPRASTACGGADSTCETTTAEAILEDTLVIRQISGSPSPASTWRLNKRQAPSSVADFESIAWAPDCRRTDGRRSRARPWADRRTGGASRHSPGSRFAALSPAHIASAVAARLEPDGKSHRLLLPHSPLGPATFLARVSTRRGASAEARDGVQCLAVQRS